jgi:hypothetical protein
MQDVIGQELATGDWLVYSVEGKWEYGRITGFTPKMILFETRWNLRYNSPSSRTRKISPSSCLKMGDLELLKRKIIKEELKK